MSRKHPQNVLLIFTDQHRLSAVGAYGETPCRTPAIDSIAGRGVTFGNAYTTCQVCSPARATIMTGQFPHTHGIYSNVHNLGSCVHEIEDRPELLSRRLESAGYACGYSGKWHLGTDRGTAFGGGNLPSLPKDVGFEGQNFPGHGGGGFHYPEYRQYLADHGYEHRVRDWSEPTRQIRGAGELAGPIESTVPYFLAENTIAMMESFRARNRPFFIWHNFWGPHVPCFATAEFVDLYRGVEVPPWPNYAWPSRQIPGPHQARIHPRHEQLRWADWATMVRYYYAFTSMIDSQIGRILTYMEKTGLLDNTAILFTADHGDTMGSHGGLIDKGWHHFEETNHIPFLLRLPGDRHKGRRIDAFVSLTDVYPTVLDLAGGAWDRGSIHGESLLPLVEGNAENWREDIAMEFGGVVNQVATMRTIRYGHLKYGYNCCCEDELYDLEADPHETRNLLHDPRYRVQADALRQRLADWMERTRDPIRSQYVRQISYWQDIDGYGGWPPC
ncbi:MAG: sulfatase-like hydrolase/transferase [Lentisphaeria bacterium]|nr:sulfatase-like hydrolase/transferase [Lentisphaeria bacterium]